MEPHTTPTDPAPEEAASLLVSADQAASFRRRRERPAEIGRYLLLGLGVVCAGAASALWITTRVSLVAAALLGFGLILAALGGTLHLFLLRDRARWPEQAHAWNEGLEVLLHDGELRATAWTDPKLALDIFVRRARHAKDDERLLVWRMGTGIPPCDLSAGGFERLMQAVVAHDLQLNEFRGGRKGREARAYEIRGKSVRSALGMRVAPPEPSQAPP